MTNYLTLYHQRVLMERTLHQEQKDMTGWRVGENEGRTERRDDIPKLRPNDNEANGTTAALFCVGYFATEQAGYDTMQEDEGLKD